MTLFYLILFGAPMQFATLCIPKILVMELEALDPIEGQR